MYSRQSIAALFTVIPRCALENGPQKFYCIQITALNGQPRKLSAGPAVDFKVLFTRHNCPSYVSHAQGPRSWDSVGVSTCHTALKATVTGWVATRDVGTTLPYSRLQRWIMLKVVCGMWSFQRVADFVGKRYCWPRSFQRGLQP